MAPKALQDLQWLYKEYALLNQKFWRGALRTDVTILLVPRGRCGIGINTKMEDGITIHTEPPIIELASGQVFSKIAATIVLAHEMIHVSGILNHGKAFMAEVDRLSKEGLLRRVLR